MIDYMFEAITLACVHWTVVAVRVSVLISL